MGMCGEAMNHGEGKMETSKTSDEKKRMKQNMLYDGIEVTIEM